MRILAAALLATGLAAGEARLVTATVGPGGIVARSGAGPRLVATVGGLAGPDLARTNARSAVGFTAQVRRLPGSRGRLDLDDLELLVAPGQQVSSQVPLKEPAPVTSVQVIESPSQGVLNLELPSGRITYRADATARGEDRARLRVLSQGQSGDFRLFVRIPSATGGDPVFRPRPTERIAEAVPGAPFRFWIDIEPGNAEAWCVTLVTAPAGCWLADGEGAVIEPDEPVSTTAVCVVWPEPPATPGHHPLTLKVCAVDGSASYWFDLLRVVAAPGAGG